MSRVTLTDTGPLVALVHYKDPDHVRCLEETKRLPSGPLLTTWPCLTEAMYLVHRIGGYPAQAALWALRASGRLVLHDLTASEADRISAMMDKYRDTPMDLADASLMAVAESLGLTRIFTLDSHFYSYQLMSGGFLGIIPE